LSVCAQLSDSDSISYQGISIFYFPLTIFLLVMVTPRLLSTNAKVLDEHNSERAHYCHS
jgi:hypothetical protein